MEDIRCVVGAGGRYTSCCRGRWKICRVVGAGGRYAIYVML